VKTRHWNQQACVAVWRDWVSQLQQQYSLTEFGHCRGISVFTQNSVNFRENTEIPRQRPNSAARLEIPWLVENCGPYKSARFLLSSSVQRPNLFRLFCMVEISGLGRGGWIDAELFLIDEYLSGNEDSKQLSSNQDVVWLRTCRGWVALQDLCTLSFDWSVQAFDLPCCMPRCNFRLLSAPWWKLLPSLSL